jgi:hypothetical protein
MNIPTFNELYQSVLTDLRNRLQINFIIGKLYLNAFAAVQAGKLKIIYVAKAFVYKNIYVDTADPESLGGSLERFGLVGLGRRPFPATAGEYKVDVTGDIGATIPPNTTFKSLNESTSPDKLFVQDTLFTFTAETGQITLRAFDLGTEARLQIGDRLQVTAPIEDVDSYGVVASVETTPTEAESYEDYRQATIDAFQLEAQGGAKTDYRLWAQDVSGVREVYPYAKQGEAGEIDLHVEANVDDSTDGKGTPPQSMLDDVEEVVEFDPDITKPLNERGRRPLGVFDIHFLAIIPLDVDVIIYDLSDTDFLSAILSSLRTFLYDVRPYVSGADNPNEAQKDRLYKSDIFNVVRNVIGPSNTFTDIVMKVDSVEYDIYQFLDGDIPYGNTVTNEVTP